MGTTVVQLWGCHDLDTADGEFLCNKSAGGYMVYLKWVALSLKLRVFSNV